jgi:hypothetical protein
MHKDKAFSRGVPDDADETMPLIPPVGDSSFGESCLDRSLGAPKHIVLTSVS